ncbi:MAG: penicillin-binding protein 2 [Acidobacteriota bacterium]
MKGSRLAVVVTLALVWSCLVVYRLYGIQVQSHEVFASHAENQQQRVVTIEPPRGTIFDRHGRPLAVSVEVDSAFLSPHKLWQDSDGDEEAMEQVLGELERIVGSQPGFQGERLRRDLEKQTGFSWIARKLDPEISQELRAAKLPGVSFVKEYKRFYPMGSLAAPVLGIVGMDDSGLEGLEREYDERIAGKNGRRTVLRDARRSTAAPPTLPVEEEERPGDDLHLTLDATLQHMAEAELAQAVAEHQAEQGAVVLMEPDTGALLALATYPSFDPNRFAEYTAEQRRNVPVADSYEPGSTFKIVTAAAALDAGVVSPSEIFDCEMGGITLRRTFIGDHKPFGLLTFREVLTKSSNVGVIKTTLRLEREFFHDSVAAFGFGRPTGVDLPGEHSGIYHPLDSWEALAPSYISFGQGIAVTPLQLTTAAAAVANGGTLVTPHVVDSLERNGERISLRPDPAPQQPVTPATAALLTRLLEGVIEPGGTGTKAAITGYRVAGKTGTAEAPSATGGYSDSRFVPSFVGWVPSRRPALVGLVVIISPQAGSIGGGSVAAPVFSRIAERSLLYLGVAPEVAVTGSSSRLARGPDLSPPTLASGGSP